MVADPWPDPDDKIDAPGVADLVSQGIEAFFRKLVEGALNPLLELLGRTLLTTPTPDELPRIEQLWEQSRQFSVASFVLIVMVAGIIVMGYETVQTRHGLKEILPRLVLAFLGANLSLLLADKAIVFANAASAAVMGDGLNPDETAGALSDLVLGSLQNHGAFLILIGLAVAVMLIVLLVTYVVRVALTLILIAAAPLAIMCYALPQTEAVARWWWRAFAGVLAIQLGQSLTLIVFLRVFLDDDGFTLFGGASGDGMVNLLVCLALFYILVKIPFWIGSQIRTGSGRSFLGSLARGFIAYKTLGRLRGGRAATTAASAAGRPRGPGGSGHRPGHPGGPPPAPPTRPGPGNGPEQPTSSPPSPHRPTGTPSGRGAERQTETTRSAEEHHRDLTSRPVPAPDHIRSNPDDRPVPTRTNHQRRRSVGAPARGARQATHPSTATRDVPYGQTRPPWRATTGHLRSRRTTGPHESANRRQVRQPRPARPAQAGQTPTLASSPNHTPSAPRAEAEDAPRSARAEHGQRRDRRGGERPVRAALGPFGNEARRRGAGLGAQGPRQPMARSVGQQPPHPDPAPPARGLLRPRVSTVYLDTAPSRQPGSHLRGPQTTPTTATTRPTSAPAAPPPPPDTRITVVKQARPVRTAHRPARPSPPPPPTYGRRGGDHGSHGDRPRAPTSPPASYRRPPHRDPKE